MIILEPLVLTLRPEQMTALEDAQKARFEADLVDQLHSFAPRLCEVAGQAAVQEAVRRGLGKADGYGLSYRGPARLFVELTFGLGANFDTDPQLPWVARILNDQRIADQMSRADFLYQAVNRYYERVAGPKHEYAIAALQSLDLLWPTLELDLPFAGDQGLLDVFASIYPEKAQYLGEDIACSIISSGANAAKDLGLASVTGTTLISGLMFGFGHGILSDPLYPWVSSTIVGPERGTGEHRTKRLIKKTKLYLDSVLAYYLER